MRFDSFMCEMTNFTSNMTQSSRCNAFICGITHLRAPCLIRMCHDSFICDAFICDITHLRVIWRNLRDVTHSYAISLIYVCHVSFVCAMTLPHVTWRIHLRNNAFIYDMMHSYLRWRIQRALRIWMRCLTCLTWLKHSHAWHEHPHSNVTWLIRTSRDMEHSYMQHTIITNCHTTSTNYNATQNPRTVPHTKRVCIRKYVFTTHLTIIMNHQTIFTNWHITQ